MIFGNGDLDITIYAENNTPYNFSSELEVQKLIVEVRSSTIKIFEWYYKNHLKSNSGKGNLIISSTSPVEFEIEKNIISRVNRV